MSIDAKFIALVPAAGSGARLGTQTPKQYLELAHQPMLYHCLRAFAQVDRIEQTYVLLHPNDFIWETLDRTCFAGRVTALRCGGETRADTVHGGLAMLGPSVDTNDWVLVHDAARPFIAVAAIDTLIDALAQDAVGGLLALPVPDTVKQEQEGRVVQTVARDHLWLAQTPQMFRYGLLREALTRSAGNSITDEAQAVEAMGLKPRLVRGDGRNFKITYPQDLVLAELLLGGHTSDKEIL
jgi:2-C-methyl-D-erythritol 4-phosphate cytidylyltransferase